MTSLQGPVETVLGKNLPISASMGSILTLSRKPCGDFTSMKCADAVGDFVERIDLEREVHAALGAELVDQDLRAGMAFDVLKEQRGTAGRGRPASITRLTFADAVGDFGDFEYRVDFGANFFEFAGAVERGDPVTQVVVGQEFPRCETRL